MYALVAAAAAGAPAPGARARALLPVGPEDDAVAPPTGPQDSADGASDARAEPVPPPPARGAVPAVAAVASAGARSQTAAEAARAAAMPVPASPPGAAPAPAPARTIELSIPVALEVHGRLFMDASADERDAWGRTLGVRSARLELEARLPGAKTVISADLANDPLIVDAYVRLDGPGATRLTAGRFKAPFSERRLESAWSLPVVERGLVDRYLVKRNGLGGRRVGIAGSLRPWGGRLDATAGAFLGTKDALEGGTDVGQDWAGRVAVRRWDAIEVGATAYRAGPATAAGAAPARWAAGPFANVAVGPVRAAVEGFTGTVAEGPFMAGTALVSWRVRLAAGRKLHVAPVAGAEALQLRGATAGLGYGAIAGAVLSWTDGLKVKLQGEWARRPGDASPGTALTAEVGSRF